MTLPGTFTPVLARLQADASTHFDEPRVSLIPGEWHERPFSHVLRLAVCRPGDEQPISHLFVKITKPAALNGNIDMLRERIQRDFESTRRVNTSMQPYSDLGAVPAVACYPEHLAMVTEEVAGPTLLQYLLAVGAWFPSRRALARLYATMSTAGRWIRVFQETNAPGGPIAVGELVDYIDHRLQRLAKHRSSGITEAPRRLILRHIDWLRTQIPVEHLAEVAIHADMSLGNVLVSDGRIVVLDFAMSKRGSRLHDLTKLFLQVELLAFKPHLRPAVIRHLQRAMLEGFDPTLSAEVPLFRLLLLLHRVNHMASLSLKPAAFPVSLYNRFVIRGHRRWIASELDRRGGADRT